MKKESITKKKIIGKCKQCGECCRDLQLDVADYNAKPPIQRNLDDQFTEALGGFIRENPHLDFKNISSVLFNERSIHVCGIECTALKQKGRKFYCSIHGNKPKL